MINLQAKLGEKNEPIANRIEQVATALAAHYQGSIPRDDLVQEMWMALIERIDHATFLAQPVNAIVNKLAWKARDYARKQFRYINRLPHAANTANDDGPWMDTPWEFIAMPLDQYAEADDEMSAIQLIDLMMAKLANRPKPLRVARSILAGRTKLETARHLNVDPSTVTGHIRNMRKIVHQMMAC